MALKFHGSKTEGFERFYLDNQIVHQYSDLIIIISTVTGESDTVVSISVCQKRVRFMLIPVFYRNITKGVTNDGKSFHKLFHPMTVPR